MADVLLTAGDKKKALHFFKSINFNQKYFLEKSNNVEKLIKSIELINYSIFINDYEIELHQDYFIKVEPKNWKSEFLFYIDSLAFSKKVRIDVFSDKFSLLKVLEEIKTKYFPDFIISMGKAIVDNVNTECFSKEKVKGGDVVDNRTIEEFEETYGGFMLDLSNGIDKSCVAKFKYSIRDFIEYRKQFIKDIPKLKAYCTINHDVIARYDESIEDIVKNNAGYIGYLIGIIKKTVISKTKYGKKFLKLSIEDQNGLQNVMMWENVNMIVPVNRVCAINIEVYEYNDRFTGMKDKKIKIKSCIELISKECLRLKRQS